MSTLTLTATLEPRGPAAAVILTDEQVAALGAGKTPAVQVTVNGSTFAGRIGRMGGENLVGFNKQVRTDLGVSAGDVIEVLITLDEGPREVEIPADLAAALTPELQSTFAALAPSHRKEFVRWITEAKKPETRQRRVAETVAMLQDGRTRG